MGKIITTDTSYAYQNNNGNIQELLNGVDYKSNYSGQPMHLFTDGLKTRNILVEILTPILPKFDIFYNVLLLRIVSELLTNSRSYSLLYVSEQNNHFISYVAAMLEYFNKKSKLYWLTDGDVKHRDNRITTIRTSYQDLLLPEDKFDFIIIDKVDNFPVWLNVIDSVVLSLRYKGLLFSLSINDHVVKSISTLFKNDILYTSDMDVKVQEVCVSSYVINEFKQNTLKYSIEDTKKIITDSLSELSEVINNIGNYDMDEVLDVIMNLEQYVKTVHPYLDNRDFKYEFNLFKEAMIDYRLGISNTDVIADRFEKISIGI